MSDPKLKCPKPNCNSRSVMARVETWFDFTHGSPCRFDPADTEYVEPIVGGQVICRKCRTKWIYRELPK